MKVLGISCNPKTGISEDTFGMETAKSTGRRVAELAMKISL